VQESFEDRQTSTSEGLAQLLDAIARDQQRKREQAERGLDALSYFVLCEVSADGIPNAECVTEKVRVAFAQYPNWRDSEAELRELRNQVTFAIFAEEDDMEKVTSTVERLFARLQRDFRQ
jgi:type I restriction enzyme R subunit